MVGKGDGTPDAAPSVLSSSGRGHDPTAGGGAMKRREFITLIGGAAAWPDEARGQQVDRIRRVGALSAFASDRSGTAEPRRAQRRRGCGGSKLKAYELQGPGGVDAMMLVEKPGPAPGPGQVLVKLKAVTINYRDLLTVKGGYGSRQKFPLVPLSDGAGVVESVGAGVASFKAGDRVTGSFFGGWLGGEPSEEKMRSNLGGALDGVLCEYRVWPAAALVRTPDHLGDAEAASLPCAGLTAWSAVIKLGNIRSGQTVLTQGTGGVSIFALQFAKMSGARVIATSSSEAKIEKLKALGADVTINYKTTPEWGKLARQMTGHG